MKKQFLVVCSLVVEAEAPESAAQAAALSIRKVTSPDRRTSAQIKLMADGLIVMEITRDGKSFRRELSPAVNYDD